MRSFAPLAILCLLTVTACEPAFAQGVDVGPVYDAVEPYLVAAVGSIILALGGLVATALVQLLRKFGLDIDEKNRLSLQNALANGGMTVVKAAAEAVGDQVKDVRVPIGNRFVEKGVNYVVASAPDAMKHFGLTPDKLAEKLEPHIARAQAMVTPVAGPSTVFPSRPPHPAGVALLDAGRVEMSGAAG